MGEKSKLPPAVPAGLGGAAGALGVMASTGPFLPALLVAAGSGAAVAIVVTLIDAYQNRKPREPHHGQARPVG